MIYWGLSRHPTIAKATAKAALEHGTGPRGAPWICVNTNYHIALESTLAKLKEKEACLLCPTGFSANLAVLVAIGSLAPLFCAGEKPTKEEKIATFSDALNHASIIDGPLNLLNNMDGLFSMDGDFAPMAELAELRKKHGFLFFIDEAHATFVWGKNGGGAAEEFNCENDVNISVGTLSKGAASLGGCIACRKTWKQFIQSRGRSLIFSSAPPVPLADASYASIVVAAKELWRRRENRKRMQKFQAVNGIPVTSRILYIHYSRKYREDTQSEPVCSFSPFT
ncbi:hypothetical protein PTKIN_Ptkin14bG0051700 [Pterospermum kingtungense]